MSRHLDRFTGSAFVSYRNTAAKALMLFSEADNPKNYPLPVGIGALYNAWFPGSTQLSPTPNSISIGLAVFTGLTNVVNRQADRLTTALGTPSVAIVRCR